MPRVLSLEDILSVRRLWAGYEEHGHHTDYAHWLAKKVPDLLATIDAMQAVVTAAEKVVAASPDNCCQEHGTLLADTLADLKRKQGESVKPHGGGE